MQKPFRRPCFQEAVRPSIREQFQNSNRVLDAVLKKNKAEGQAQLVQHKDAISAADKERLDAYFEDVLTSGDTHKLQSYVWYCFARHGLRGGEVFAKITRNNLQFCSEEDGSEIMKLKTDFLTKNTPGGLRAQEFTSCGQIQEKKQVESVKKLLSLLHPSQTRLFQRVLLGCRPKDGPWFANAPLGKNTLADMMPLLSVRAKLSMRYTNHCVRATVVTDLKDAGISNHGTQRRNERSSIRPTRQGRVETSRGNVKRPRRCSATESSEYATASSRGSRTTGDSFSPRRFISDRKDFA